MSTPASIVKNWKASMQSGTVQQKYADAIQGVQQNPMEAAAAAVERGDYLAGIQRAIANGKMTKKLRASSFANWKNITSTIGKQNLSSGAAKGEAKVAAASQTVDAAGKAAKAAAAAVPKSDWRGRVAAAVNAIQAAHGYPQT